MNERITDWLIDKWEARIETLHTIGQGIVATQMSVILDALKAERARADDAEAKLDAVCKLHRSDADPIYTQCTDCGELWPCTTARAVGDDDRANLRQGD